MARPLLWLALLCASLAFITCAAGIRLELVHVDSKDNYTVEERMRRATERTHRRLASMGWVTAPIHYGVTQYIAEYLIGNPPQKAEAIIDTGSNLIWTQCSLCRPSCFKQNLPYYDPSLSRTVRAVGCNDTACALGSETGCLSDNKTKTCGVGSSYGAGSILGFLGTESFTFQSETVSLVFGCIFVTKISPGSLNGASGIIGLGRGKLSLVSQLGETKFSYCLTPYISSGTIEQSHMIVGVSASLSTGAAVTSVPFVKSPEEFPFNTFYYLPLTGITVGKTKLDIPSGAFDLQQVAPKMWKGTLIDSGSPFTSLVDVAYQELKKELVRQLGTSLVKPPAGITVFDVCVALRDYDKLVPPLVLHFGSSGGADLVVPPKNYWAALDRSTVCMVVLSSAAQKSLPMNETTVIGNFMQQNMHVLYDLAQGVLSFQQADCSSI